MASYISLNGMIGVGDQVFQTWLFPDIKLSQAIEAGFHYLNPVSVSQSHIIYQGQGAVRVRPGEFAYC